MDNTAELDIRRIPEHIAIIMDGNGRWATQRGKERSYGHQAGVETVRRITSECTRLGVKYLTLYTFSTENWNRPAAEVEGLMKLLSATIDDELSDLMKNNIRVLMVGDGKLPSALRDKMLKTVDETKNNTGLTLILALSYSGRWDITQAARNIAAQVKNGTLNPDDITADTVAAALPMSVAPDPELIVRTSGEYRISNFLLWQAAYSEFYFTDTLWPDFDAEQLYKAIVDYQHRERRFGKTSEQVEAK